MSLHGESRGFAWSLFRRSTTIGPAVARCLQTRHLSHEKAFSLLLPHAGQRPGQVFELHPFRLSALEDRVNDIGREQRELQQAINEAASDALGVGDLTPW